MAKQTLVYNEFRGGEWGLLGGEKAPSGTFHGKNMMVYSNGLLGPRPGLKDFTPDGMPNGKLRCLVETPVPDREAVFIIGSTAYYSSYRDFSINPVAFTGDTLTGKNDTPLQPKPDTATHLVAIEAAAGPTGGGVFRLDTPAGTVSQIDTAPPGVTHELYNGQLLVVESYDRPRLLGSDPTEDGVTYDFSDGFFTDIGDNWGIAGLLVQRNYVAIFKRNSAHVLSGVFGDNSEVVRQVSRSQTAHKAWHIAIDNDDRIWFIPLFRENIAQFTGAALSQLGQYVNLNPREGETGELPVTRGLGAFAGQLTNSSFLAVQGGETTHKGILYHNGVFTFHEYEQPVCGLVAAGDGNHVSLTDGGADDAPATIYGTSFELDRPAFVSDGGHSPYDGDNTDPIDAEVEFPYFFDKPGNLVRVRSVTVEIKKWDTGITNNTLDLEVTTLNRSNGAGDQVNTVQSWSEASGSSSTSGDHDRLVFSKHCLYGQGFKIKLKNIAGIAIKSVTVDYEEAKNIPRKDNG